MNNNLEKTQSSDVLAKQNLAAYQDKKKEWIELLSEDEFSIINQFYSMVWDDAAFRIVNESWSITFENKQSSPCQNYLISGLIERGYIANQILSIRKLTDPQNNDPAKGVISLRRLIADIQKNKSFITRENYVCEDAVPYDGTDAHNRFIQSLVKANSISSVQRLPNKGSEAWNTSEIRHRQFDKISKVTDPSLRQRDDLIHDSVFEELQMFLDRRAFKKARSLSNKYVAHMADQHSRKGYEHLKGMTLDEIHECQKFIYKALRKISAQILNESDLTALPIPQYDLFKGLDKPWVKTEYLPRLQKAWKDHEETVEQWGN